MRRRLAIAVTILLGMMVSTTSRRAVAGDTAGSAYGGGGTFCGRFPYLCTDPSSTPGVPYVGHDEPSLIFYSTTPGAGNSFKGLLTLPKDPLTKPNQSGTAGTWNFQLHPAFWFGMAMCDTQSAPEFTNSCTPDSDTNIFDNASLAATDYIGKHPGTAFMEMQFYPPGWVIAPNNIECSATKWCAALNVDSLSLNMNTGTSNNSDCVNKTGIEPVNFALITNDGVAVAPADPLGFFPSKLNVTKDVFLMNAGDTLEVRMFDTANGFEVVIRDLATGKTGSMTASTTNGFAQEKFDPTGSTCQSLPYAFHPMYATAGPHTRVSWAAHSYNVAFSDEVGHFEYCSNVDPLTNACLSGDDGVETGDDGFCFAGSSSSKIKVGGCTFEDLDFDGPTYLLDWPGTMVDPKADAKLHPAPVKFSGSLVGATDGSGHQFDSVAFETDLPAVEHGFGTGCDTSTGSGCVNPPPSALFYPVYTTTTDANGGCVWQLGGTDLPNTVMPFGDSTAEYGAAFPLVYPEAGGPVTLYNDFQQALGSNPCSAALPTLNPSVTSITFSKTKAGRKSAMKVIKLRNSLTNKVGLGINAIQASTDNAVFTISKSTCTAEVLPKKSCNVSVVATPSLSGHTDNGNLLIDSDSTGGRITIPLAVTGS